jgi:hypothetical protein
MAENYEPPHNAWRLRLFVIASPEELRARQVTCGTCPVFILCENGEGGTGYVCEVCGATGIDIEKTPEAEMPKDLLVVDCGQHKFNRKPAGENLTLCSLCSGGQMDLEVQFPDSRFHYLTTVYAKVPVKERQKKLREALVFWEAEYAKEPKEQ